MKNNILKKLIYSIIALVQVCLVIGIFVIEYLTNKSAGVMHHVYYMKYVYESGIFAPEKLSVYKYVALLLFVAVTAICAYLVNRCKGGFYKAQLILLSFVSLFLYVVIGTAGFKSMLAYPYLIMAVCIVFMIQVVVVGVVHFTKAKS